MTESCLEIQIRGARDADGRQLRELDVLTWSSRVSPAPPPPPDRPFFRDDCRPEDVLVAEGDGVLLGYVLVHEAVGLPSHRHVFTIDGLAVDPAAQGRGVGRALVEAAAERARSQGATKLTLRVLEPNTGARRLYESAGFVIEGTLVGEFELDGQLVDDLLMARWLT